MQVRQAHSYLGCVEDGSVDVQTRGTDVVNVEAKVTSVHESQHHAQGILGLVRISQVDLCVREGEGGLLIKVMPIQWNFR